jgi:transposase-like protein
MEWRIVRWGCLDEPSYGNWRYSAAGNGSSIAEVARVFKVNPNVRRRWRRELRQGPSDAVPGGRKRQWDDAEQAKLEWKIGQPTLEADFQRAACKASRNSGRLG